METYQLLDETRREQNAILTSRVLTDTPDKLCFKWAQPHEASPYLRFAICIHGFRNDYFQNFGTPYYETILRVSKIYIISFSTVYLDKVIASPKTQENQFLTNSCRYPLFLFHQFFLCRYNGC